MSVSANSDNNTRFVQVEDVTSGSGEEPVDDNVDLEELVSLNNDSIA